MRMHLGFVFNEFHKPNYLIGARIGTGDYPIFAFTEKTQCFSDLWLVVKLQLMGAALRQLESCNF